MLHRLHVVVDIDRDRARNPFDIAADHKHDSKLSERVRETQDHPCDKSRRGKRDDQLEKCPHFGEAERPGGFDQFPVDLSERRRKGLHGERQAVENRGDQQAIERKRQWMADELRIEPADRAVRTDGHENVETKNGRRQHQRQRHNRLDEKFPAPRGIREPIGDRQPQHQQQRRQDEIDGDG